MATSSVKRARSSEEEGEGNTEDRRTIQLEVDAKIRRIYKRAQRRLVPLREALEPLERRMRALQCEVEDLRSSIMTVEAERHAAIREVCAAADKEEERLQRLDACE